MNVIQLLADLDDPGLTQSKFNDSNAAVQTLPQNTHGTSTCEQCNG